MIRPKADLGSVAKPWMRFIGFIESGDPYASQTIDEWVYDCPPSSGKTSVETNAYSGEGEFNFQK